MQDALSPLLLIQTKYKQVPEKVKKINTPFSAAGDEAKTFPRIFVDSF